MSEIKIIPTTGRNNCGGRCIIYAHVRDGVIEKLSTETRGTPDHPVPLCACAKGLNYHKTFLGEDRLRYPMKRIGERGGPGRHPLRGEMDSIRIWWRWRRYKKVAGIRFQFVFPQLILFQDLYFKPIGFDRFKLDIIPVFIN